MIHTRQVKDWCNTNQYWQSYINFDEYNFVNGMLDRFGYRHISSEAWERSVNVYVKNNVYRQAHEAINHRFKGITEQLFGSFELCNLTGWKMNFCIGFRYGKFHIHVTSMYIDDKFAMRFPFGEDFPRYEYNGYLDVELAGQWLKAKIYKDYLYGEGGAYSFIMLSNCWDRPKLKHWMKYPTKDVTRFDYFATCKALARRYNIESDDLDQLIRACKRYGKQNKRTALKRYTMDFIHDFDGDIDEAEAMFYDDVKLYEEPNKAVILV